MVFGWLRALILLRVFRNVYPEAACWLIFLSLSLFRVLLDIDFVFQAVDITLPCFLLIPLDLSDLTLVDFELHEELID